MRRPIEEHLHVGIARGPGILDQRGRPRLVQRVYGVTQPVERFSQGRPPALGPAVVAPGPAATIVAPPLHAVRAAPRGSVHDPGLHRRRMSRQERGVVGQRRSAAGLDPGAGGRQRHLPEAMVMAVGLAVGRDLNELRVRGALVEPGQETRRHRVARAEEPIEGDPVGDRSVVEKESQRPARAPFPAVGPARVECGGPGSPVPSRLAHAGSLSRREEREAHALLRKHLERLAVRGRLREPHPVGLAPEATPEVGQAPSHLGDFVAAAAERKDRVSVRLRDRIPVSSDRTTCPISLQDRAVDVRALQLEPRHKRGTDVERERGEVVHDVQDAVLRVDGPRRRVRAVTLGGDAGVPVVIRRGGVLDFDALEPWALTGRLVEVAVDRDESGAAHERWARSGPARARRAGLRPARWLARGPAQLLAGTRAVPAEAVEEETVEVTSEGAGPNLRVRLPCLLLPHRDHHRRHPPPLAGWRAPP